MGSVLGRLLVLEVITARQYAAGDWVAQTIGRYERLTGMPRRTTASPSYDRSWMGSNGRGGDGVNVSQQRASKAEKRYDELKKIINARPDKDRAWAALEDVCCSEIEISSTEHAALAEILSTIAKAKGLGDYRGGKSREAR